jgi:hypothetical protein
MNDNNKPLTAIEWLESQLYIYGLSHNIELFVQAKQMEKQQLFNAHINGQSEFDTGARRFENDKLAERWYNQAYIDNNQ